MNNHALNARAGEAAFSGINQDYAKYIASDIQCHNLFTDSRKHVVLKQDVRVIIQSKRFYLLKIKY